MLVEIWSDVVCPWCAIGKARFETALQSFPHADDVEVVWRSFELDPNAPQTRDGDLATHLATKYGTDRDRALGMMDQMTTTAAAEGLTFRFDIAKPGNTFDAHRLLHLAKANGLQHDLGDRLFAAYLTEGEAIAEHDVLQRLAVEVGLDEVEVKDVLTTDRYATAVREDEAQAQRYGIRGVPFFVVDQQYGVSGAQPAEALLEVLQTAWADSHPLTMVTPAAADATDEACADGSCDI